MANELTVIGPTSNLRGGTIYGATLDGVSITTSTVTGGLVTAATVNNATIGTSTLTGGVLDKASVTTSTLTGGAADKVSVSTSTLTGGAMSGVTGNEYQLSMSHVLGNLADNANSFLGLAATVGTTAADVFNVPVPIAGTITAAYVETGVSGTLGTTETCTVSYILNATATTTVSTAVQFSTSSQRYSITGLATVVAVGDRLQMKLATPTFVTNPTGAITVMSLSVRP